MQAHRRKGGSEAIARFMTGVVFAFFANVMTGVQSCGVAPPFSPVNPANHFGEAMFELATTFVLLLLPIGLM